MALSCAALQPSHTKKARTPWALDRHVSEYILSQILLSKTLEIAVRAQCSVADHEQYKPYFSIKIISTHNNNVALSVKILGRFQTDSKKVNADHSAQYAYVPAMKHTYVGR